MQENFKEYVDMDSALNRVRGNKMLYRKMLDMFLSSKEFDALEEALGAGDNQRAGEIAHAIKGMTGNLSFTKLFETSTELMNQMRQGGDADPDTLASYREAFATTFSMVKELAAELDAGTI